MTASALYSFFVAPSVVELALGYQVLLAFATVAMLSWILSGVLSGLLSIARRRQARSDR